jgi:hypothetical protein
MEVFRVSTKTGEGMKAYIEFLESCWADSRSVTA